MKYFKTNLFVLFFMFSLVLQAQHKKSTNKLNPGKCYIKCFVYDSPNFSLIETDCNNLYNNSTKEVTKEKQIEIKKAKDKLLTYQKKMKNLGYNVEITGLLDDKTIIAHKKYLKKKKRIDRKNKRKSKK